jgi:hypothetical protein
MAITITVMAMTMTMTMTRMTGMTKSTVIRSTERLDTLRRRVARGWRGTRLPSP